MLLDEYPQKVLNIQIHRLHSENNDTMDRERFSFIITNPAFDRYTMIGFFRNNVIPKERVRLNKSDDRSHS